MGATTFDGLDRLRHQSPITHVHAVTTPTLVIHSEEDWRCPPEQGEQWFAALRRLGVPTLLLRVPGENHELTRSGRPSLRIARFHEVANWWHHHLTELVTTGRPGSSTPRGPGPEDDGRARTA